MYDELTLANFILQKEFSRHEFITHSKLQRIMFYVYGYHMAITNNPLTEDGIRISNRGPYFEKTRIAMEDQKTNEIHEFIKEENLKENLAKINENEKLNTIVNFVCNTYSSYVDTALSAFLNAEDSLMSRAKESGEIKMNNEQIKEYFIKFIRKEDEKQQKHTHKHTF